MSAPLVTAVIPTYNSARFIRETVESVLAQTFTDYEVVVVDDASTDPTVEILNTYAGRIRVVRRTRNSHSADVPRHEGVENARGRYCAFLDSDDRWHPEKLEKQVAFMEAHPDIPLSHTYVTVIDDKAKPLYRRHDGAIPPTGNCARELLAHCFISTSSVMVRSEDWERAFREADLTEDELKTFGTEWDLFLVIAREHPVGFIPEPLTCYRRHAGGISRTTWKRHPWDTRAKRRIFRRGLWQGVVSRDEMREIVWSGLRDNWRHWFDRGLYARAAYFAVQALRYEPAKLQSWFCLLKSLAGPIRKMPGLRSRYGAVRE